VNGPFPRSGKKRPPPERGIKVTSIGATWWGTRWIDALERISRDYQKRLARGRTYARTGRVHDLVVAPGRVRAQVTGSSRTPYRVDIRLGVVDDGGWRAAVAAMAERAAFAAALLAGEMPHAIDEAFSSARGLFPAAGDDLATECSCPDWANPCKHVAATHYVIGEALDRDPFLLFELRGRTREQVLAALRGLRGAPSAEQSTSPRALALADRSAADYDRGAAPLPRMRFHEAPEAPALAVLAAPPGWQHAQSPLEVFGGRLAAAARLARALAGTPPSPDDDSDAQR
jgi:uncharacterized Zn finger protein